MSFAIICLWLLPIYLLLDNTLFKWLEKLVWCSEVISNRDKEKILDAYDEMDLQYQNKSLSFLYKKTVSFLSNNGWLDDSEWIVNEKQVELVVDEVKRVSARPSHWANQKGLI